MSILSRISSAWSALRTSPAPNARALENPQFPVSPTQMDMVLGLGPTRSGVQINEHTAMTVVAIFAAHKIIGETLGMLPWAVYRGDEDEKNRVRAKDHAAYKLLRRYPNDEMTPFTWRETSGHHCLGWGNCYSKIVFDNAGRPKYLRPLNPDTVHPERKGGQLVYRVTTRNGQPSETLWPAEMFHVPALSYDGLKGYSPVAMAREAIGAGKAAEIFASTFYGNGTRLSGHIEMPGRLKPEAIKNLQESFAANHAGTGNQHKSPVFEEGMKWVKESCAPDEAQFLQTRQFSVVDIARLYRIPPHMLADHSRATHSNIEQASLEFLIYTMSPWFAKFEQEADRKLTGEDDNYYVKFDERALLRTDMASRQERYASMRQWGVYSANDVLRDEGDEPIGPQGDVYLSPVNMQNAKITAQQTEPPPVEGPNPKGSGGKPGNSPFGGTDPNAVRNFAARSTRVVFEDAMQRMLRKEANAQGNGKANDHFYEEHRKHVAEALAPALNALRNLLAESGVEVDMPAASGVVDDIARERHKNLNGNAGAIATEKADAIINAMARKAAA